MRIYREADANMLFLADVPVAVVGYGRLGRPLALNLRDSSVNVIIGNIDDIYAQEARKDNFTVLDIPEAVARSQVICMAIPDEAAPRVYLELVGPHLKTGDTLAFMSGYNLAYRLIEPPVFVDVGVIAPRTLASTLRAAYLNGTGFMSYFVLHQQATDNALSRLLALGYAFGALKQGALEMSAQQEVALDLFGQHVMWPAIHSLLLSAARVLQQEGFDDEAILTELYLSGELATFFQQAAQIGFQDTLQSLSLSAQYGILSRTERFQETKQEARLSSILHSILNGDFAQELADEYADGYPRLARMHAKLEKSSLWQLESAWRDVLRGL
ncbi:MAG: NAD(P)-binding domain-containing protein [Anaerolineales bacterium]